MIYFYELKTGPDIEKQVHQQPPWKQVIKIFYLLGVYGREAAVCPFMCG